MSKEAPRVALLEAGRRLLMEKGYNNTGIQEVVQAAEVPKGSFYYYFKSKEDFGLQIIDGFAQSYQDRLEKYLTDTTLSPLARLRQHVDFYCQMLEAMDYRSGCLVGTLGQELANQNDMFRSRVAEVFTEWREHYENCFREAQQVGELAQHLDVETIADFYLSAWEGAMLQVKVRRSILPFKRFIQVMFEQVLKP
jgi:TetR/AcrR family transcriptional regulator, transcriptional repressor for nem operon